QLGEGPGLLGGLQSDPGPEGGRMSLSCALHDAPRDGTVISDQFNIPSGPVLGVHLSLRWTPLARPRISESSLLSRQATLGPDGQATVAIGIAIATGEEGWLGSAQVRVGDRGSTPRETGAGRLAIEADGRRSRRASEMGWASGFRASPDGIPHC